MTFMTDESQEFTALIQGMMPMAEQMLDELGAFLPYAAVLYADGEIRHLTVDPESGTHQVGEILSALEQSLHDLMSKEEEHLAATALCMDIKMKTTPGGVEKSDADSVSDESADRKNVHIPNTQTEAEVKADQGHHLIDDKVDCIMFRLESSDGNAMDAFRPYAIDQTGHVRFSRMFATQSNPEAIA